MFLVGAVRNVDCRVICAGGSDGSTNRGKWLRGRCAGVGIVADAVRRWHSDVVVGGQSRRERKCRDCGESNENSRSAKNSNREARH